MRSPIGPILVAIGLATASVLVLVLLQTMSLRDDLRQARSEVATLQSRIETAEAVTPEDLRTQLAEMQSELRELVASAGADGGSQTDSGQPAGGSGTTEEILDRLDDVLARITALDRRVDEICDGVPVC